MTTNPRGTPAASMAETIAAMSAGRRETAETALKTISDAAIVAAGDVLFRETVGPRLGAALAATLRTADRGLSTDQMFALARLASTINLMAANPETCVDHRLTQRRDHRPPWCSSCGRDRYGVVQGQVDE